MRRSGKRSWVTEMLLWDVLGGSGVCWEQGARTQEVQLTLVAQVTGKQILRAVRLKLVLLFTDQITKCRASLFLGFFYVVCTMLGTSLCQGMMCTVLVKDTRGFSSVFHLFHVTRASKPCLSHWGCGWDWSSGTGYSATSLSLLVLPLRPGKCLSCFSE